MRIYDIRVDYASDAVGIDSERPVFSWKLESEAGGVFQKSYRIKVFADAACTNACWDSGAVESGKSFDVVYDGEKLMPDTRYYFTLTVAVGENTLCSDVCSFTTALLDGHMPGQWICVDEETPIAPLVRKSFCVSDAKRVTLYFFSYGWYELYVNGHKFDGGMFLSNYSGYGKVLFYDVFDLTECITAGENCIGLQIGDGYNKNLNRFMEHWEDPKRFIGFLSIERENGEIEKIYTDETWKYSIQAPILSDNIYNGETYDARKETDGWSAQGFDDADWSCCRLTEEEEKLFRHIPGAKIDVYETFRPTKIYVLREGSYILDFGQNMAGFVRLAVAENAGSEVTIAYAEELKVVDGEPALDDFTNRNAKATDTYICRGSGLETYTPHFTYHGFRYVRITGLSVAPSNDTVVACAIHTAFDGAAEFDTDNPLLNQLYSNALWSMKSNNIVYSSDCAARDERTPCAMDLLAYHDAAVYCADLHNYFLRWLWSAYNEKEATIRYPSWDGQILVMTALLYHHYGDTRVIETMHCHNTDRMHQYMRQWPDAKPKKDDEVLFGDWCIPNVPGEYETSADSRYEVEVAALALCAACMADMETVLGNAEEALQYRRYYDTARQVYNELFFDPQTATYSDGKQTPNILALADGLAEETFRPQIEKNLLQNIRNNHEKLHVGIFGTRHFIECLADAGDVDLAIRSFFGDEFPSFKYQFDKGATTLWEQWYESGNMASHNHAMFAGAITGFFTRLAGITPAKPGFSEIVVKPVFSKELNRLNTTIETPMGSVKVHWQRVSGKILLQIGIPTNATAVVSLPGEPEKHITNGNFSFEIKELTEDGKNHRQRTGEYSVAG